jgi:hypothetical protein
MLFLNLFILRSKKKTVEIPAVRAPRFYLVFCSAPFAIPGFSRAIPLLHVAIKRLEQKGITMRFKPSPRHAFNDTSRKRAAVRRRQQNERDALPLLAAMIEAEQPTLDDVMTARAASWAQQEQKDRAHRAAKWREARRKLTSYRDDVRPALLAFWQRCGWPADPVYLLEMLHMFNTGQLELPG